jgi:hypothetical protein
MIDPRMMLAALANLQSRGAGMQNPHMMSQEMGRMTGQGPNALFSEAQNFLRGGSGMVGASQQPPPQPPQIPQFRSGQDFINFRMQQQPQQGPEDSFQPPGAGISFSPPPGQGPATVGQAADMSARGSMVPGAIPGIVGTGPGSHLGAVSNAALAALGLAAPSPQALFTGTNFAAGKLAGLNVDPTTGLPVGSQAFRGLAADPMFSQFIDMNLPPQGPFAVRASLAPRFGATPGSPSSNPAGMHADPTAPTGFTSSNVVDAQGNPMGAATGNPTPNSTNFGASAANDTGISDPGVVGLGFGEPGTGTGSAGGGGGVGAGGGTSGEGFKKGGIIHKPKSKKGGKDDAVKVKAHAGEFVVNKKATDKHRGLLEALNLVGGGGGNLDGLVKRAQKYFED